MSKKQLSILLCVVSVLLVIGGSLVWRSQQKSQWISRQVDTQMMHEVRQTTALGRLEAVRLSPGKTELEGQMLYSATYYPQARTVLATVDLKGMEKPGFYLVFADGRVVPGWYKSDMVKYDITQVAFENLLGEGFAYLDFVDQAKIPSTGYNPKDSSMPRVRFPLSIPPPPPPSWANPASSGRTPYSNLTK